jgi:hypothetical protein
MGKIRIENICPTITLTHGSSSYSEKQRNDLNTGLFLRTCLGGGHLQKGTRYYTECGEMTDGCW